MGEGDFDVAYAPHANDLEAFYRAVSPVLGQSVHTIVEVGSLDGHDVVQLGKFWPGARLIAIEAVRENYLAHMAGRTEFEGYCEVVDRESGPTVLYVQKQNGLHSLYNRGMLQERRAVTAISLADFCAREDIGKIDVMKLDVEGAAWDVLAGMNGLLDTLGALHVELEGHANFWPGQKVASAAVELLEGAGMVSVGPPKPGEQGDMYWVRAAGLPAGLAS